MKIEQKNFIDVNEWDAFVVSTYDRPYSFQQQDGCKERGIFEFNVPDEAYDYENETIPEKVNGDIMGVSFKSRLERNPKQKLDTKHKWDRDHGLELFWERNLYPNIQMIANDLHNKGLLPEGNYIINIDW